VVTVSTVYGKQSHKKTPTKQKKGQKQKQKQKRGAKCQKQ
jgi:hypothetical protein